MKHKCYYSFQRQFPVYEKYRCNGGPKPTYDM